MHGPFDRAAGRATSIIVLKHPSTGEHRLVTSISTRASTEVLQIDPFTGELGFDEECASFDDEVRGSNICSGLRAAAGPFAGASRLDLLIPPRRFHEVEIKIEIPSYFSRRPAPYATSRPGASPPSPAAAPCWAMSLQAPPPACCSPPE